MDLQKLYSFVRKAVYDYQMIEEGDKIAVGISGGKDSLALLYALAGLKNFYPVPFTLHAITVDPGFERMGLEQMNFEPVAEMCKSLEVPYTVVKTQIGEILKAHDTGKPVCSLCARLRRGTLKDEMLALGCNKLAYGHHKDDVIETALLSLLYGGNFYCFAPVTRQDSFSVIRPMIYVPEGMIRGFAKRYELPVVYNPCPYDNNSRRSDIKEMLRKLTAVNKQYKNNIFHAITLTKEWKDLS